MIAILWGLVTRPGVHGRLRAVTGVGRPPLPATGRSRARRRDRTAERAMRAFVERSGVYPQYARLKRSTFPSGTAVPRRVPAGAGERGDPPAAEKNRARPR